MLRALALLLVLAACSARKPGELEAGNQFLLEQAQRDIVKARADLAARQDPTFDCVSVEQAVSGLAEEKDPAVQQLRAEGARLCGHDAPLAWASQLTVRMQGARSPADCTDLERALAVLEKGDPNQPDLAPLRGKQKLLCP